ncbi:MAG: hypothetical protein C0596_08065 [Marinilabiliales bacterium]|nr:MAG: hypothetical protein C0596_08065 [Marinilabiliales bacterium]
MQLLKKRSFGDFFNDTFTFIKQNGKHYFKHYFILTGIPIAIMTIISFAFGSTIVRMASYRTGFDNVIEDFMHEYAMLFILLAAVVGIIAIIFSIIQYTYTPAYLILYNEKGKDFDFKDIFRFIFKEKIGKIIIYILFVMVIIIPVGLLFGIVSLIFLLTIIGVLIPISAFNLWFTMAYFTYLKDDKSVGSSFGYAWNLMFNKFWRNVGSLAIFTLMILLLSWGFNAFVSIFTNLATLGMDNQSSGVFAIILLVGSMALYQIVNFFLQIALQLMQGIVYFSLVEEKENTSTYNEIDQIGLGAE